MSKKHIFISGSIAYDDIKTIDSKDFERFFGGCSANIAYNLKLMKTPFIMHGLVGKDFGEYEKWMTKKKLSTEFIIKLNEKKTSRAVVVNHNDMQQVRFDSISKKIDSATLKKIDLLINNLKTNISLAIISPDSAGVMVQIADSFFKLRIPYFFDPGPIVTQFKPSKLKDIIASSFGIFANHGELNNLLRHTKLTLKQLIEICPFVIVTLGKKGSKIYFNNRIIRIEPVLSKKQKDPTGCGDAYRAGFLSIIYKTFPKINERIIKRAGATGSRLATKCLEKIGTQLHTA